MRRVLVVLLAILIGWLGLPGAVQAQAAEPSHNISSRTVEADSTSSGRGATAVVYDYTALRVGADAASYIPSALPHGATPSVAYTYDDPATRVRTTGVASAAVVDGPGDGVPVPALKWSRVAAKSADVLVLVRGHYPEHVDLAKATGGRTFQVPTKR